MDNSSLLANSVTLEVVSLAVRMVMTWLVPAGLILLILPSSVRGDTNQVLD